MSECFVPSPVLFTVQVFDLLVGKRVRMAETLRVDLARQP
jgi:hypothetical protein